MKLKGVKPIEQHFEKIIVAVMAVVFVLVLLMQFVGEPNQVSVGRPAKSVPPDQAYLPAQQRAEDLKRAMSDPAPPGIPEDISESAIAQRFESALTEGVSPVERLAWSPPSVQIEIGPVALAGAGRLFAEVAPPAPQDVVAAVHVSTIDPLYVRNLVRENPEATRFFPDEQPFDMAAVSIEASFDGPDLERRLEEDPDGEGEYMPLRTNWWRGKVAILQVRLEREELTDTGEWTNLTVVPPLPGNYNPTDGIEESVINTRELETLVTTIDRGQGERRSIRRARYLPVMAGQQWRPPSELAAAGQKSPREVEIENLVKRRGQINDDLLRWSRQTNPNEIVQRKIEEHNTELARIDERLRELGVNPGGPANDDVNQPYVDTIEDAPLLSDPAARIWAHDITAEPGKTYRYRIGVAINNPAFGRDPIMDEQQLDFASRRLLIGEMSEWTEPVRVAPMERYFLVSATRGGPGGLPGAGALGGVKATASVFKFYYGFWRKGTVSLEPGDEIIARVDVPENLFLFDFDRAPTDDQGQIRREELTPPPADEDGDVDYPSWWVPAPRSLPVHVPAQFLDAYEVAGAERSGIGGARSARPYEAVLTEGRGELVLRRPDEERASPDLKALTESAELGETQGQPEVTEQKPVGPIPGHDPVSPVDPGSGGGGGGG